MASIASDFKRIYRTGYYSTKNYNKIFARMMQANTEFKNQMTQIIVKPGYVSTNMIRYQKVSFTCVPIEEEQKAIMKSIGVFDEVYGHWHHEIHNSRFRFCPQPFQDHLTVYYSKP